jgi:hypothetical protein
MQGRCRLLLVDNIAATVWHDRAAVFSAANQHLPYTLQQQGVAAQQQQQQQQQWPLPAQQQQQQWPPWQQGQAGPTGRGGQESAGPGFDALRVQRTLAALLQTISQQWRLSVVVTKQTGVQQVDRSGTAKLVQREILTEPLQVWSV